MSKVVFAYDAELDAKKRIIIKGCSAISKYHVQAYSDGKIVMEPRVLSAISDLSASAQRRLLETVRNFNKGVVGTTFNPKEHV